MNLKEAVRSSYFAQGLSEGQLESLYALAELRPFDAGEEILREFDDSRDLMILANGSAKVMTVAGELVGQIKAGMPMGEIAFLDGRPRSGTVIAQDDCHVVVFPAGPLTELMMNSPELASRCLLNISKVLCARLRTATRNLAALMAIEEVEIGTFRP